MEQGGNEILLYGILLAPFVILGIIVFYLNVINPFSENRRYIKDEMHRSCDERGYRYWKRELKKLYIMQIPFLGNYIVKRMR